MTASGVEFFDDIEDPGHCRRAAFAGSGGSLVVLTISGESKVDAVVFACDARIGGKGDLLKVLPEAFQPWIEAFEIVYFGRPV
ncbi:hypothetical protein WK59_29855 [Burkholderia ubonensis]|nr:hypothetical protein WK59_29855 [Burkholderia ubonensis]KVU85296.1 hypothetical protein WK75_26905 [Burkholderia ubonensis]KWK63745.1 hypothetical protein WM15_12215 [Burkholderia ubonensis]